MSSAPISADYDLEPRLSAIRQPLTVLTADTDTLVGTFERVCALRPDARRYRFAGHHPLHEPDRAAEYAALIDPV